MKIIYSESWSIISSAELQPVENMMIQYFLLSAFQAIIDLGYFVVILIFMFRTGCKLCQVLG